MNNENNNQQTIEAIAEEWVNLVLIQIRNKDKKKNLITNYKKENKYGTASV